MGDGGTIERSDDLAPRFDRPVPPDGYAWWYVDGLSDDRRYGLTVIGFVGSVFSPYYAWARRRGPADPTDHVAINVALYGGREQRWAMTERGRGSLHRTRDSFAVGPSAMRWERDALTISVDEIAVPLPARVRGRIRVLPGALTGAVATLEPLGRHRWRPIAPRGRIEVEFDRPRLRWSGDAYLDSNDGDVPLERDFVSWDWSRAGAGSDTVLLYDVRRRDGGSGSIAIGADARGSLHPVEPPPPIDLPVSLWRVPRQTRADADARARVVRTLTDAPFYARSEIETTVAGRTLRGVHESLFLDRFTNPVVQAMLPFRMPRRR